MMLICNLAKSDVENRTKTILPNILKLLNDDKIMVKRQTLQNIWKIAVSGNGLEKEIINSLTSKFLECTTEKHYNLIRIDILESLLKINKHNEKFYNLDQINELIASEDNPKNYIKYNGLLNC